MNHKVNSVAALHESALKLNREQVMGASEGSATTIMKNLKEGIEALKNSWQGMDAGTQINNVVTVYNAFVKVKNLLAGLSVETSRIASDYRSIQRANGAQLEDLAPIAESAPEVFMEAYSDTRDTVSITPDAVNGKAKIDAANNSMDVFVSEVRRVFAEIMENWTEGPHRQEANEAFDEFVNGSSKYKELLNEVSQSVATALQNYGM